MKKVFIQSDLQVENNQSFGEQQLELLAPLTFLNPSGQSAGYTRNHKTRTGGHLYYYWWQCKMGPLCLYDILLVVFGWCPLDVNAVQ